MKYLSVFEKDEEILKAMSDIHLKGKWFDLDCTYSKGVFYKNIERPKYVSDLVPLYEYVIQSDCRNLVFLKNEKINSIVFDPPFLFRNRKSINNDKISLRFSYFKSFDELIKMYKESLNEFYRVLNKGGYIFFKCQDMSDGKFYATHCKVIDIAYEIGFELKDICIKKSNKKLQKDALQQNCFAKSHSYWVVLKKVCKT